MRLLGRITDDLPPKGVSLFLLIAGLVIGSVFTFGNMFWFKTVSRDEALPVTAEYKSYTVNYRKGHSQDVIIRFNDHKLLDIHTYCATDEVINKVASLEPGTEVNMLVHPNSDTIIEMETEGDYILRFDDTSAKLKSGRTGYFFIGGFMYLCCLYGAFCLIYQKVHNDQ